MKCESEEATHDMGGVRPVDEKPLEKAAKIFIPFCRAIVVRHAFLPFDREMCRRLEVYRLPTPLARDGTRR